jgi:hypothetical protein
VHLQADQPEAGCCDIEGRLSIGTLLFEGEGSGSISISNSFSISCKQQQAAAGTVKASFKQ